ncbi:uncharacterized protein LOC143573834 [Bidens hawaiensis]|uniref:uncharacterized protein LOC143573834 n=1 Tax=Bidens hawaiensis TaxID=980011 RepID=UPI004049ADC9
METYGSQNTPSSSSVATPEFDSIPVENWNAGDGPIGRILKCTRPTLDSECHRSNVVWYIQQLIHTYVGGGVKFLHENSESDPGRVKIRVRFDIIKYRVLRYGSGPLRTYLPDGDVDLTVVSDVPHLECDLPRIIYSVLEAEIHRLNGQGVLKEAKCVSAKVKLIKCVVDGIMIDISFNQISGLYALCFLDQVDLYIQKDHLFKLSIILIKTWCYHESRLMGAARGLISTYALETLVLHIFHMYDTSLDNPLKVLYRFLEYYSKFEWNKFAVSIRGPVDVSLLPFTCSVVNIIDPLKSSNNLGASVHSGK